MMRKSVLGAILLTPLVTAGCIPDVMNTKPEVRGLEGAAPVQTLYEPAAESEATLRPGGELVVRLASNPTTGYYWYQIGGEADIVSQVSEQYVADPAPEGLVGSGGEQEFRFRGEAKGTTTILLSYQRHEGDMAEQCEIKVKVIE